jgi:hypothetical protein
MLTASITGETFGGADYSRGGKVLAGDPKKKLRWRRHRVISIR